MYTALFNSIFMITFGVGTIINLIVHKKAQRVFFLLKDRLVQRGARMWTWAT